MTPNQWSNLRQFIYLTLEIRELSNSAGIGDKRVRDELERMRLQHSALETSIREACVESPATPAKGESQNG